MWCDYDFVLGLNINPDIDFNIVNVIVVKGVHIMSHHVKNVKSAGSDGVIMLCFYSMTS